MRHKLCLMNLFVSICLYPESASRVEKICISSSVSVHLSILGFGRCLWLWQCSDGDSSHKNKDTRLSSKQVLPGIPTLCSQAPPRLLRSFDLFLRIWRRVSWDLLCWERRELEPLLLAPNWYGASPMMTFLNDRSTWPYTNPPSWGTPFSVRRTFLWILLIWFSASSHHYHPAWSVHSVVPNSVPWSQLFYKAES